MKRKIPLILVLGIVGVLVVSFIIDSRTSATLMMDVEVCETGYGCETIGYMTTDYNVVDVMDGLGEEWHLSDPIEDWEFTYAYEALEEVEYLFNGITDSSEMLSLYSMFEELEDEMTYYPGYSKEDLPYNGRYMIRYSSSIYESSPPTYGVESQAYTLWTPPGQTEPMLIIEYTIEDVAIGCWVITCTKDENGNQCIPCAPGY